jgi:UbiD family decarboxylase
MEGGWPDLRAFVEALRHAGELRVVEAPVDPRLEAAEIHRRVIAAEGPALLFRNPRGSRFPLVMNLFGTRRRAERAFGARPLRLVREVVALAETLLPPTLGKLWAARGTLRELGRIGLRRGGPAAPVTEARMDPPDLTALPATTSWPEDGGPFLTLPLVYTEHPERPGHNLGIYRMQVHDAAAAGMHWQIGKGGGFHYHAAEAAGRALPVTVFLGGPPALLLSAVAPLPENVPELLLASMILGRRLPVARHPAGPHPLVADAEFALVGRVEPRERRDEGPFGDHYGYYSLKHPYPVFRCDAVFHRQDAMFPATVVGKPRQEDFPIGDLLQELLSPLFPLVMPGVRSLWSYGETGFHSLAAAVVRERYRREAIGSGFRILGEGQLSLTKFLLVFDRPVELRDFRATLEHLLERTEPESDLFVFANVSMDTLDYTGPKVNEGSKGMWLGLGDPVRRLPREFRAAEAPAGMRDARVFCGGCVVVEGPAYGDEPDAPARFAAHPAFAGWPLVVLTDDARRATASGVNFLWTTFTRFEPAADVHAAAVRIVRNHVARTPPIVIDARIKPWYPKELFADEATAALVTRRWREYFPDGGVAMGDSGRGHLSA